MYESLTSFDNIELGQSVYIVDAFPLLNEYNITPSHIRNIRSNGVDTYLVALEETKEQRSRLFKPSDIGRYVFLNIYEAEMTLADIKEDNKDLVVKLTVNDEVDYDE